MHYTDKFVEAACQVLPEALVKYLVQKVLDSKVAHAPDIKFKPEHLEVVRFAMDEMLDRLVPRMKGEVRPNDSRYLCHILGETSPFEKTATMNRFPAALCNDVRRQLNKCMGERSGCGFDVYFSYTPAPQSSETAYAERVFTDALYRSLLIDPAL